MSSIDVITSQVVPAVVGFAFGYFLSEYLLTTMKTTIKWLAMFTAAVLVLLFGYTVWLQQSGFLVPGVTWEDIVRKLIHDIINYVLVPLFRAFNISIMEGLRITQSLGWGALAGFGIGLLVHTFRRSTATTPFLVNGRYFKKTINKS